MVNRTDPGLCSGVITNGGVFLDGEAWDRPPLLEGKLKGQRAQGGKGAPGAGHTVPRLWLSLWAGTPPRVSLFHWWRPHPKNHQLA